MIVSETHANGSLIRTQHLITLDQPDLLEALEVLRGVGVEDRIRHAAETMCQALIEAELTEVIGMSRTSAVPSPGRCSPGQLRDPGGERRR